MDNRTMRTVFLPYALQRLADGRYILLNRHRKPIGIPQRTYVDYNAHPSAFSIENLTPSKVRRLSFIGSDDASFIKLYNDECVPDTSSEHWASYQAKLQLLASLAVEFGDLGPP